MKDLSAPFSAREPGPASAGPGTTPLERLRARLQGAIERALLPLSDALTRLGVRPNQVTVAGTLICLVSPLLVLDGRLLAAGLVWLAGSALDLVDGALARRQGRVTARGAFLDSSLDRVSEGALFAAIAYRFATLGQPGDAALAVLALLGAFMISYARARSEALGAPCKVGLVTRAERVVLLGLGLCLDLLAPAVYLLLVLSALSAAQRVRHSLAALG